MTAHVYTATNAPEGATATAAVPRTAETEHFFPDISGPLPVHTEISGPAWLNERLQGPTRANHQHSGMDIVLSAFATSPGTFHIEDSTDGHNWSTVLQFDALPNEALGVRFRPGSGFYRATWVSQCAASHVLVESQMVPALIPYADGPSVLALATNEVPSAVRWVRSVAPAAPAPAPVQQAAPVSRGWLQRLKDAGWL